MSRSSICKTLNKYAPPFLRNPHRLPFYFTTLCSVSTVKFRKTQYNNNFSASPRASRSSRTKTTFLHCGCSRDQLGHSMAGGVEGTQVEDGTVRRGYGWGLGGQKGRRRRRRQRRCQGRRGTRGIPMVAHAVTIDHWPLCTLFQCPDRAICCVFADPGSVPPHTQKKLVQVTLAFLHQEDDFLPNEPWCAFRHE